MQAEEPSGESNVERIAERFLDRLQAGEEPDEESILGSSVAPRPALSRRLKVFKLLHKTARRLASGANTSIALPLRCPHCGHAFSSVGSDAAEIVCPSCNGGFRLDRIAAADGAAIPDRIGRFQILHLLGRGAFGAVYKGHDQELDRFVAVKVPRAGQLESKEAEERFLREARSAARLHHPGIVKVHEVGVEAGVPFLVSDFVPSRTLAEVIAAGRPSFQESALLAAQIAEALDHAHREKVIHRDIKPANILIDAAGDPHVSDFGLARRDEEEVTLTLDGQILGTPAYMSPEQASGDHARVGPASDQYSLGVVLYELLTGERPFRGSRSMILQQVLNDEPRPPRYLNDRVPRDIETICLKTLAKEPGRRYESCRELADDLRRWIRGEPIVAHPLGRGERAWRWARRNPVIATLGGAVIAASLVSSALAYRMSVARNEATDQLVQLHAENGARRLDEGDLLGSMRAFAEALRLKPDDAGRQRAHNIREATILDRCPRLLNVWFLGAPIRRAEIDDAGGFALTQCDRDVRVFDLAGARQAAVLDVGATIRNVALSRDGALVAIAARNQETTLWRWRREAPDVLPLQGSVNATWVVFNQDGSRVLACDPRETRLYDTATGKGASRPFGAPQNVVCAAFSPDGSKVATASADWTARVWDASTSEPVTPPMSHGALINHIAFSHDGLRIATASEDFTAQVWDVATGRPHGYPLKHDAGVWRLAFSPDDSRLATACRSNYACIWNADTGERVSPSLRHQTNVYQAAFRFDGRSVATASSDGTSRLWDAVTGAETSQPLRHGGDVVAAFFLPDGHRVLTAAEDGTLKLWDTARGEPRFLPNRSNNPVGSVAFSPDGKALAIASHDSTARLWDVATAQPLGPWLRHSMGLNKVIFNADGKLVATASWDGTAEIWDAGTGAARTPPLAHGRAINDIAFSPDGSVLATASDTGSVSLWSTSTGARAGEKLSHPARAASLAFSPDGRLLVVGTDSPAAVVWSCANGEKRFLLQHGGLARRVAFSPTGRRILTASTDGRAMIWDAATGASIASTLPHSNDVIHAGFSPDGSKIVTTSYDGTARIWSTETGQAVSRELRHDGIVFQAAFSPDGALLATACGDGSARVWDAITGDPVTPRLQHGDKVLAVAFAPDGAKIATGSEDNFWRLWSLRAESRPTDDVERIALLLSHRVCDARGTLVPASPEQFRAAWDSLRSRLAEEFTAPEAEIIAWHGREAEDCMRIGLWRAAVVHYDRFIEGDPRRFGPYKRRAHALANLDEWSRAAADFEKAFELGSDSTKDLELCGETFLLAKDTAGYQRICERAVLAYAKTTSRAAANTVAWLTCLGPNGLKNSQTTVAMAREIVEREPENRSYVNTLGGALYRAGVLPEAEEKLLRSVTLARGQVQPIDWALLSMTRARMGHIAEATTSLERARAEAMRRRASKPMPGKEVDGFAWVDLNEMELFLAEAEAVLAEAKSE
jgi:WD40 repeat protein/tRNA A-37 threonylcarbamoyl transferase component Bud32/tetratricopeptide (TPR) repeat protein